MGGLGGFSGGEGGVRAGRVEGGGRGGTFVQPGYGPILCGRFGVKNARVVKKVGEKETPLGEKETPLGEKVTKVGEEVNFVGEKKIHAHLARPQPSAAGTVCRQHCHSSRWTILRVHARSSNGRWHSCSMTTAGNPIEVLCVTVSVREANV